MKINQCTVSKKEYVEGKAKWETIYTKSQDLLIPCGHDYPDMQLEENLGLSITAMSLLDDPQLNISLYTYKRTFVVASATEPIDSKYINFNYRKSADPDTFIQVSCLP
jgi:hypothetical protein